MASHKNYVIMATEKNTMKKKKTLGHTPYTVNTDRVSLRLMPADQTWTQSQTLFLLNELELEQKLV